MTIRCQSVGDVELVVPGYVAMELIDGCRSKRDVDAVIKILQPFRLVWPSPKLCSQAYEHFTTLHLSHGLGTMDSLIAQTAIGLAVPLHTFNQKHFAPITMLETAQPYVR